MNRIFTAAKAFLFHPLGQFVLFITFLYQVKENYPFTHIPMYSDPEARAPYYHLADGDGKALGVKTHGGITNPKMRKMFRKRLEILCKEKGYDKNDPPQEAIDAIGKEVIAFLRKHAVERGNPLPDTVRLIHVLIEPAPQPDGFKETSTLSTRTSRPPPPGPNYRLPRPPCSPSSANSSTVANRSRPSGGRC